MDLSASPGDWNADGFILLPGYLPRTELQPAVDDLPLLFPTADQFHGGADEQSHARFRDEFTGIDDFPFKSTEPNLLAVHDDLVQLASTLLGGDQRRVYSIEAWAKHTGAAHYDQHHHRDYLSQTMVVPSRDPRYQQVEMFLYLSDVPSELGPPSFVSRRYTSDIPALPNWYPRLDDAGIEEDHPEWISQHGRPELYELEVTAAGPAGTVVAYANDTFHRGTFDRKEWIGSAGTRGRSTPTHPSGMISFFVPPLRNWLFSAFRDWVTTTGHRRPFSGQVSGTRDWTSRHGAKRYRTEKSDRRGLQPS